MKSYKDLEIYNLSYDLAINPTMILSTLSFRRKPESSQNITGGTYFGSMVIDPLLDAVSVMTAYKIRRYR